MKHPVWLLDLDDTLHDASHAAFAELHVAMADYVAAHLEVDADEAGRLRERYWLRYGATLLGLVRHHGVRAAHFLAETHRLPGLEERLRTSAHDRAALARLPGRKFIVTNAPRAYTMRVLRGLGLRRHVEGVITIEDMVPKEHITTFYDVTDRHTPLLGRMMALAPRLMRDLGVTNGFRTLVNTGADGMLGHWIGLGVIARGAQRIGERVRAYDPVRNGDVEAEVCSPVFVDPEGARLHG